MSGIARVVPCRGCRAMIGFIKTEKGKTMPVDPEEIYFVPGDGPDTYVMPDGRIRRGRETGCNDLEGVIGYRSHFATCPVSARMRKGGRK